MTEYRVTWMIDVEADTPREAAVQALRLQRDPGSWATVFTVRPGLDEIEIDLDEIEIDLEGM